MQKKFNLLYLFLFTLLFTSCEELIDVNLNEAAPRVVIEAHLNNLSRNQAILVSKTVNFDANRSNNPIDDALVYVMSSNGRRFNFVSVGGGRYENNNMFLSAQADYKLMVEIDKETFTATETLQDYVDIDSLGVTREDIFNEIYYFVNLKFHDPKGVPNYYLYTTSVNGGEFKFNLALNDKYDDGQAVTHQLGGRNQEFKSGDDIVVRRHLVSKNVYKYWSEYQMTNPGSAAPANPTSNISNGALGYFSISNVREYSVGIQDTLERSKNKSLAF